MTGCYSLTISTFGIIWFKRKSQASSFSIASIFGPKCAQKNHPMPQYLLTSTITESATRSTKCPVLIGVKHHLESYKK